MDLEVAADHDLAEQAAILERLRVDLRRLALPITIFATADAAVKFEGPLRALVRAGHEVACHGLTRARAEDYRVMTESTARVVIGSATRQLFEIVGREPRAFRGPFMLTSRATQRALLANGYISDFSVCAQRLDLVTARGGTCGWLTAPRFPYHPSARSPYRIGSMPLWVVPMRCLGAPFVSALLYLGGVAVVTRFFETLLSESRRTTAPIVYLFHSYEFTKRVAGNPNHGPFYHRFYLKDRDERYQRNLAVLEHMVRCDEVRPLLASELLS
jgi:hypothetical protein